jgi:Dyp-type peroxidase family
MDTPKLDFNDMQGLLARGYGELPESCYLMLQFGNRQQGKDWLAGITGRVSTDAVKETTFALQIAFTYRGIIALLDETKLQRYPFSREFTDGMTAPERQRILGDLELNGSDQWDWGADTQQPIHAVLMLYAKDSDTLQAEYEPIAAGFGDYSIRQIIKLDTNSECPDHKEHFGFADGMSQPKIDGFEALGGTTSGKAPPAFNIVQPGEFVLGYANEYDKQPFSPAYDDGTQQTDIGRNGSYMVFRQLEQRVKEFWAFIYDVAKTNMHFADKDPVYIASKMVGRFPNGNPLTLVDDAGSAALDEDAINDFLYKAQDADGLRCPVGAHIRKSHPRDGIDDDPKVSVDVSKRHRILRRGRSYGAPLDVSMEPDKMLASANGGTRGLYFICFNANIARQFEFVQQAWDNNPKFGGLEYDVDPIIGYTYMEGSYSPGNFTIPDCPVRRKVNGIPQFVFVKGGAYFFMPGVAALKFMANLK